MKIGIITMHRVQNFGSVLQAYALQKKIGELGHSVELIDYIFPIPSKKVKSIRNMISTAMHFLSNAIVGFPNVKKNQRFREFRNRYYKCSAIEYDHNSINLHPPMYDVYVSGSDQVWSPRHVKDNTDFMCSFAPKGSKIISYASSFAVESIPQIFQQSYKSALSRFSGISVREHFGCEIVKLLTGKHAIVVADPTLLLTKYDWNAIADCSKRKEKGSYILVYTLSYMFNPYPEIHKLINKIQTELGLRVIYLNGSRNEIGKPNSKIVKDSGPCEFLDLIRNAKFVITTSFHGVAFSCIYGIPFYGVVQNKEYKGDRIKSLLCELGCENSLVEYSEIPLFKKENINDYICKEYKLKIFREQSQNILIDLIG